MFDNEWDLCPFKQDPDQNTYPAEMCHRESCGLWVKGHCALFWIGLDAYHKHEEFMGKIKA